jgi:F0F1-type ATP synthase membrane subunit b/b'
MIDDESTGSHVNTLSPAAPETDQELGDLRHYVPGDLVDVSFPIAVRGYERAAVDAYVRRANRAIAELKVSASPAAAVRHALDQAQEKADGLLRSAREAGEEITTSAQVEAEERADRLKAEAVKFVVDTNAEVDRLKAEAAQLTAKAKVDAEAALAKAKAEAKEILASAKAEAQDTLARSQAEADERRSRLQEELADLQAVAETRLREIKADTQAVWRERDQMLDGIRTMANDLVDIAKASVARLQPQLFAAAEPEDPGAGAGPDQPTLVVTDEPAASNKRKRGSHDGQ